MPRTRRLLLDGYAYHVLNRGNDRRVIFKKAEDYQAFLGILAEAQRRVTMTIVGACLMPNHWHLVLWPQQASAISAYMHWAMNTHVHRYHLHYGQRGLGHLYQDRYKSFPIQDERHLFTVLRYVEANPLRGGLVRQAEAWDWSSLALRSRPECEAVLGPSRVRLPENWGALVNEAIPRPLLQKLQHSASREVPFGDEEWVTNLEASENER